MRTAEVGCQTCPFEFVAVTAGGLWARYQACMMGRLAEDDGKGRGRWRAGGQACSGCPRAVVRKERGRAGVVWAAGGGRSSALYQAQSRGGGGSW